jgi:hypothetical protein
MTADATDPTATKDPDPTGTTVTARTDAATPSGHGRLRGVLAGIALILASISITLFSVGGWVHQVALNTDRFTAVVEEISTDPAVTDAVAHRLSVQVVEALGVQERLEARLPDPLDPLAGAFATAVQDAIDTRLATALQEPALQEAWINAISTTHRALVALLREQTDAAVVIDGYVYFDAFVLLGPALTQLQSIGIIPADVVLPDLSARETVDALRTRLEAAIGITLPPDFGLVKLMPADRLLAARGIVKAFDLLIVLLAVVSIALALLSLWLAQRRLRQLVFLGLGAAIALVLARLAIRGVESLIVSGITDPDAAATAGAVLTTTVSNVLAFTNLVLIGSVVLAIVAYLASRPRWVVSAAGAARGGAGQVAATAGAVAGGAAARPSADEVRAAARSQRARIERLGIAIIIFVLAWIALGIEIAVIGAALLIAFELAMALLSDDEGDTGEGGQAAVADAPEAGAAPTGETAAPTAGVPPTYVTPPAAAPATAPEPHDADGTTDDQARGDG